jgi:hypothetical protein
MKRTAGKRLEKIEKGSMNETLLKVLAIVVLFLGEALAIYTEMLSAKAAKTGGVTWPFGIWILVWMVLSGVLLLAGYYLGYLSTKNIWVVTVTSIASILIAEPILIIAFFNEWPTTGAWIGMGFALLGMIAAFIF